MRKFSVFSFGFIALSAAILAAGPAQAEVVIHINKSTQRMTVVRDGQPLYQWAVSTGRAGYGTPSGVFGPQRMARSWFSHAYYNSPMPHSIFFHGGYAIHGSYETASLGRAASHGCIRLSPGHAAELYQMVAAEGARITITGTNPYGIAAETRRHGAGRLGRTVPDEGLIDGQDGLVPVAPASDGWSVEGGDDTF